MLGSFPKREREWEREKERKKKRKKKGETEREREKEREMEGERKRDSNVCLRKGMYLLSVLLLRPRGMVSREHLPDQYMFFGLKERPTPVSLIDLQLPNEKLTQRIN